MNYEKNNTKKSSFWIDKLRKYPQKWWKHRKRAQMSGYHGIGHLFKRIIPITKLPEIEKLYSKMSDFLGAWQAELAE